MKRINPSFLYFQGTSPIYNLLPDMLSSLSSEASLPPEHFQAIMRHLLTFIAKEKQVDSLVEKLCLRFAATQASKLPPQGFATWLIWPFVCFIITIILYI